MKNHNTRNGCATGLFRYVLKLKKLKKPANIDCSDVSRPSRGHESKKSRLVKTLIEDLNSLSLFLASTLYLVFFFSKISENSYALLILTISRCSPTMELIRSDDFYILQHVQKGESNLWISRHTGQWEVRPSWDLAGQENLECLGLVWALYGKLSIHPDLPERLVLVKHCDRVAELPGGPYSPNSLQGKNSKNQYSFNASQKRSQVMLPKIA